MQTIWISPTEYVTGDPSLVISYPSVSHPNTVVTSKKTGDLKWISMGLRLPPNVSIEEISICYQVSNPQNFISQVRLVEMDIPDQALVIHDDGTDLKSTNPVCYISNVGGKVPTPGTAVTLLLRLNFQTIKDQQNQPVKIMLGAVGVKVSPIDICQNHHLLSEFGPYASVADAEATFQQALAALIADGGGVLCIPRDAPQGFYPRNLKQNGQYEPAVTVFDYRMGIERVYVPPMGTLSSDGESQACHLIERDLAQDLGWQNVFSTESIQSRYLGGASSYLQPLTTAIQVPQEGVLNPNQKLHVPSHRGLFVGQTLLVTGVAGFGGVADLVSVKELGLDNDGPYFVADLKYSHPAQALVYNKNVVSGLTVKDTSNCDNQSASLNVERKTYGTGDTFGISMRLGYQGDILSAGGDEGGVGISSQIEHDIDCFWGEVESWNPQTRALVYKPLIGKPHKLGTSRPLINMNPNKRITAGQVMVVRQGSSFMPSHVSTAFLIVGTPDAQWDSSVVGRFIAIDEPSEYYDNGEATALGATSARVHRWWHITAVEPRSDGYFNLFVERTWWFVITRSYPLLFRASNYTNGSQPVLLSYIIAPGTWVSDVRRAVTGNTPGKSGLATVDDERTLVLAPSPSMNTPFDFEPGDAITNPPGSNPWVPTAFRARHLDNFPGSMQGISFLSENLGKVQLGAGLYVLGPYGTVEQVQAMQKDGEVTFDAGVYIFAATVSAIRIRGPVQYGAIDLWQPDGNEQKIRWFTNGGASASTLHARPDNGDFVFAGGNIDHMNTGSIRLQGISATSTPAQNLRGINVPIAAGGTQLTITFPAAEADSAYAILAECSWMTNRAITNKTATGFTVIFDQPAPRAGGTLDWLLVR